MTSKPRNNSASLRPGTLPRDDRPSIVLILVDDMGFSDIGCYGSEISTPNLDRLGTSGVRFTQMYNTARCCPSRASLLTGLYAHQAGVGFMVRNNGFPGYQGYLNDECVTLAEALGKNGYTTMMSGKWHVGGEYNLADPSSWRAGDPRHPTPRQRGFDRFYGILGGAANYFYPKTLMRDDDFIPLEISDYYLTDAISDEAVRMVEEAAPSGKPFFLYAAYTAPHWPLHATEEDIAAYEGSYRNGWDTVRTGRHEELKKLGLVDENWQISPKDAQAVPWENSDPDWEDLRMATYAAQITSMDRGVGRILDSLEQQGVAENTLVMFLSDNGGCAEFLTAEKPHLQPHKTNLGGAEVTMGNVPGLRPGPADTFMSYDISWANASNAPFRRFKHWVHEGGISTPFIVHWPARIAPDIVREPAHLVDIYATCLDVAGATYLAENRGHDTLPMEGESFLPALEGAGWSREQPIFWEHEGNRAVRVGDWKLVNRHGRDWELFNMSADRTETENLAGVERTRVKSMAILYGQWAERCGVLPWPLTV